jgi:hypothetical protein
MFAETNVARALGVAALFACTASGFLCIATPAREKR